MSNKKDHRAACGQFVSKIFTNDYSRSLLPGSINFVKSWMLAPVDDNILEILFVDGHRGWPSLDHRLLLLNVVGSNPLHFANPEHDIPCSVAKRSIARQTSSCVIFSLLWLLFGTNPNVWTYLPYA